jgi:hypothetical protein
MNGPGVSDVPDKMNFLGVGRGLGLKILDGFG